MKYIINLEPKIKATPEHKEEYCNVISTKDATITRIYNSNGISIKERNEIVKKGDILIAGEIKNNEEIKGYTCANGIVYGNTWYTINIEIPKYYEAKIPTKKHRYNILFNYHNKKNKLLKTPFSKYISNYKKIVNIFNLEISLIKEQEITTEKILYNDTELEQKINTLIDEKMSHILNGNYQIKDKKVLKKTDNNSTIYIDMFIVTEEQISQQIKEEILKK